jgi:hypothetical protein
MATQSYMDTLLGLRDGSAIVEASERLTELIAAVRETGKGGSITLKINVRPASKGKAKTTVLMLEDQITDAIPQFDKEATMFFASDENLLSKRDPRQMEIEGLRVVEDKPKQLREVV